MSDSTWQPDGTVLERRDAPDRGAGPPLAAMPLSQRASLFALLADYALFTYGPWACFSGMDYDYLREFTDQQGAGDQIVQGVCLERPLFDGFQAVAPEFNHVLMACETAHWNALLRFLGAKATVHRRQRLFARCVPSALRVRDELEFQHRGLYTSPAPSIPITSFNCAGNRRSWWLRPAEGPPPALPRLVDGPPAPAIVALAERALGTEDVGRVLDGHLLESKDALTARAAGPRRGSP